MPFDNKKVPTILSKINNNKLLLIDWNIHSSSENNYVFQDFGEAFYDSLKEATDLFKKYKELVFVYPEYTHHPKETITFFKKYCEKFNFPYKVIKKSNRFILKKNKAYISVSDRVLGSFLEQCKKMSLEPGKDVGFLSYNETPMKKFIYKGISVISTDFDKLGTKAAEFVTSDKPMQQYISTKLILRESL